MIRRHQQTEQEFGSDSFLDIIANIVGILIILIVIVGMKVARQPPESAVLATERAEIQLNEMQLSPEVPAVTESPVITADAGRDEAVAAPEKTAELNPGSSDDPQPSVPVVRLLEERQLQLEDLKQQRTDLEQRLEQLRTERSSPRDQVRQLAGDQELLMLKSAALRQQHDQALKLQQDAVELRQKLSQTEVELHQKLIDVEQQTEVTEHAIQTARTQHEQAVAGIRDVAFETLRLREVLTNLENSPAVGDRLEHRLAPVGELVEKGELHFRVEQGRISHVPLEQLLDRLKAQVQSRRSAVARFHRYEGSVGPVAGYRMNYTVERESMSALESMQYGTSSYRVSVSRWTVLPDASLEAEPVEMATRPGSRFRQIVETSIPGSAITFWIYPDSFSSFPALREIAHGLQLRVAARPLPEGTPIVGSPGGSRSTAQ